MKHNKYNYEIKMKTFKEIAEMRYQQETSNDIDEKYKQSRINTLEQLLTKELTIPNNNEEKLRQLFKNGSDCYADTWHSERGFMEEGEVIQAITEDKFIAILKGLNLINTKK